MDPLAIGTTVLSATLQIVCDRATTFTQQSVLGATTELECALEKLQMTLSIVKSMVSDNEKRVKRDESSALHTWLLNLRNVVYDAEDVLDGMEYDRLKLKAMKTTSRVRAPLRYITTKLNPTSFSAHSYVLRINVIQERLSLLLSLATVFKLEMVAEASMPISDNSSQLRMISSSVFYVESCIFGRAQEKLQIISMLLDNPSTQPESATKSGVPVVAVVGIGGLGKTTLAQHAFHDTKVSSHFHLKTWVCVSNDFNVDRIIEEILKDIASSKPKIKKYKKQNLEGEEGEDHYDGANEYIIEKPTERLKEELKGNRFLLVLDDVWNEDVKKWNDLVRLVNYGNEGSKILVTTRKMSVVNRIPQLKLIDIGTLSESDTHLLLMQHAFCDVCRKDLYDIGLDITKKLKGSPLAAKTIGRILSSDLSKEHWNSILKSELWDLPQKEGEIMPALKLSYERLPNHLKPCFAFCSLFPKDYQYKKMDMVEMWISLGLVQQDQGRSIVEEDMGIKYVNDLLDMCMFQPCTHDENLFTIHDLIHDVAIMVSKDEFLMVRDESCVDRTPNTIRHLAIQIDHLKNWDLIENFTHLSKLRSLIFHCHVKSNVSNYDQIVKPTMAFLKTKLCMMRSLRILHLSPLVMTHIPRGFSNLRCLRYLNFVSKYKKRLPGSLSKLYHMQVLVLQDAFPPNGIHNLVNLRHVRMESSSIFDQSMFKGIDHIKDLKLLQEVDVKLLPKDGTKIRMLSDMKHMRDLRIKGVENIKNLEEATQVGLSQMNHLTSIELRWYSSRVINKQSTNPEILEGLQPNKNIKRLSIYDCPGDRAPNWLNTSSLQNIQEIDLSRCKNWQSLSDLQQLSHLKSLHLYDMWNLTHIAPYMFGKGLVVPNHATNSFSCLSRIEISVCSRLTNFLSWIPPTIVELLVVSCPNIREVATSSGKGWLPPALKKLELHNCGALGDMLVSAHLENLSHLEYLDLSDCKNIESIPASCSGHIQRIYLDTCASLRRVSPSALKDLRYLSISRCHEFVMTPDDSEGFHVLTRLDMLRLTHCRQLGSAELLGIGGGLRILEISGLENIDTMENCFVTSTSLKDLTLVDLPRLQSLPTRYAGVGTPGKLEPFRVSGFIKL